MSYQLHVYSQQSTVITRKQLAEQMLNYGWETMFTDEEGIYKSPDDEELHSFNKVYGWRVDQELSIFIRKAMQREDDSTIISLYDKGIVGVCEAYADKDDFWSCMAGKEYEELVCEAGKEIAEILHTVNFIYIVRFYSNWDVAIRVWHAIGILSNGVMADPHTGADGYYLDESTVPESLRFSD